MEILLGLAIVIALLFLIPSFSTIREWNEGKKIIDTAERNPNMIVILLLLVIVIGLLFFVPELFPACVVIGGGLLYWWNLQSGNKTPATDHTKHYFSGSQAKRDKGKPSEFNSNSTLLPVLKDCLVELMGLITNPSIRKLK